MKEKREIISCADCNADFTIIHDMYREYDVQFCPFCGEEIIDAYRDDHFIEFEEDDNFFDEE